MANLLHPGILCVYPLIPTESSQTLYAHLEQPAGVATAARDK